MIFHGMGDATTDASAGFSVDGSVGFSSGGDASAGTPETQGSGPPNITASPVMQSGISRAISSAHRGITGMLGGPTPTGAQRAMTSLSQARMTGSLMSTGYKGTTITATAKRMGTPIGYMPSSGQFPVKQALMGLAAGAFAIFAYKKWVR